MLNTDLRGKQDADTAITTANIGRQSVNYATSAGSAIDNTARTNANMALAVISSTITFKISDIGNGFGTQYAIKVGKMVFIHMLFKSNNTIAQGTNVALIPSGCRPNTNYVNIAILNQNDNSVSALNIMVSGYIVATTSLRPGIFTLDFCYPIA